MAYIPNGENGPVIKEYADLTGYDTAAAFTVTGDVEVRIFGIVGTPITSTSGTTTLSLGTTLAPNQIGFDTDIDGTNFDANFVWADGACSGDAQLTSRNFTIIANGADIIMTRSADDITAGSIKLYCYWRPTGDGGSVVAA